MTGQPGTALTILAQIKAQAAAGQAAIDGLHLAASALEAVIKDGLQGPFEGVFNALPNGIMRRTSRGKIDADPELQAFIRARVMNMTFPQVAAVVAQNFAPERRVAASTIHRWWHRRGKQKITPTAES
jgi:hypothetical protein